MSTLETSMKPTLRPARAAGFTLIELMITVVVATILLAIAIPSYRSEILSSRRTDAKTAVLDLATREQRYYSLQNSFTTSFINLGYVSGTTNPASVTVGSGYYTVSIAAPAPAAGNPPTFTVTATTTGSQTSDTACQTFTVDNTGLQKAYDSSNNDNTTTCWK
jgi:type IV pilus assembly protein PilE